MISRNKIFKGVLLEVTSRTGNIYHLRYIDSITTIKEFQKTVCVDSASKTSLGSRFSLNWQGLRITRGGWKYKVL